jgi:hypothetical protein
MTRASAERHATSPHDMSPHATSPQDALATTTGGGLPAWLHTPPRGPKATWAWARALRHRLVCDLIELDLPEQSRYCLDALTALLATLDRLERIDDPQGALTDCVALLYRGACGPGAAHDTLPAQLEQIAAQDTWRLLERAGNLRHDNLRHDNLRGAASVLPLLVALTVTLVILASATPATADTPAGPSPSALPSVTLPSWPTSAADAADSTGDSAPSDSAPADSALAAAAAGPDPEPTGPQWGRPLLWHPTGPWRPIPPGQSCRDGLHPDPTDDAPTGDAAPAGNAAGSGVQQWCQRRLQRRVTALAAGPWQRHANAAITQRAGGPTASERAVTVTWQQADATRSLLLARASTIGHVEVLLGRSVMHLYDPDGHLLAVRPLSAGKPATPTPTGTYRVTSRSRHSVALVDRRIKLEHMVRFNGSIGFHGIPYRTGAGGRQPLPTPLGEANVSLGCVRLDDADAAWLYTHLADGATVIVTR